MDQHDDQNNEFQWVAQDEQPKAPGRRHPTMESLEECGCPEIGTVHLESCR